MTAEVNTAAAVAQELCFEVTATDTKIQVEYHVPESPVLRYELTHAAFAQAMRAFRTQMGAPSGLVTNGRLLYCETTSTGGYGVPQAWLFEREPEWITLEYVPVSRYVAVSEAYEEVGTRYRVFLPYTVWFITPSGQVQLAFSPTPITDWDQPLYLPLLPNVYFSSVLCLGDAALPARITGKERLAWAYQNFFEQRFNNDLVEAFHHACSEGQATALIDAEFIADYHDDDSVVETGAMITDALERWEQLSEAEVLAADWPTIRLAGNTGIHGTATVRNWIDRAASAIHSAPHRRSHALHTQLYYARSQVK